MDKSLFEHFSVIKDPRYNIGKKHQLMDILIMVIYGILNGYSDFTNIAHFLKINQKYFIELLDLKFGTPSHDCISDLFALINPDEFMNVFIQWIKSIVKEKTKSNLSIDGKAIKAAKDRVNKGNMPYIVSAFLGDIGISIGQIKVESKSNEITAIPQLLDLIDIKGSTVTIDAIGTQEKIANKIVEKKAHYVLSVKDNQKNLNKDIQDFFNDEYLINSCIKCTNNIEKDHGRIEKRDYYLNYDVKFINSKSKWKTVNAIGMMRVEREVNGKIIITNRYYIIDYQIEMDKFITAVRSHWNIECGLHWRLDVILNEDRSRNRVDSSIENLSAVRKIVFNLASLDNRFGKVPLMRKITNYRYDFKNIEKLLFEVIPSL